MRLHLVIICLIISSGIFGQTYFPPTDSEDWETTDPIELGWCEESIDTLREYLDTNNTKAFMILKGGRIVLEEYFDDHTSDSFWYWASAAKTITATLTGKALEDGDLELTDPISQYLGLGWSSCDSIEEYERTIWNQLTMTSSFNNSPFLWDCTEPSCYQCIGLEPGTQWHYHNGVYRRLIEVIEIATGFTRNGYTNNVIEGVTGMSGFWAENLYFSKHRDMARFGWLAMNEFVWDGTPVLTNAQYIEDMISPSQSMNPSYGYLWWLNGQDSHMFPLDPNVYQGTMIPSGPDDMYMALGANDQKIYVVPSLDLVVTRQGDAADAFAAASSAFDVELWELISNLDCGTLSDQSRKPTQEPLFYPNPHLGEISIPVGQEIDFVRFTSISGLEIAVLRQNDEIRLPSGLYIAQITFLNGRQQVEKLVIK